MLSNCPCLIVLIPGVPMILSTSGSVSVSSWHRSSPLAVFSEIIVVEALLLSQTVYFPLEHLGFCYVWISGLWADCWLNCLLMLWNMYEIMKMIFDNFRVYRCSKFCYFYDSDEEIYIIHTPRCPFQLLQITCDAQECLPNRLNEVSDFSIT